MGDGLFPERMALASMPDIQICRFVEGIYKVSYPGAYLFFWLDKTHLVADYLNRWVRHTHFQLVDMIVWSKIRTGDGSRSKRSSEFLAIYQKPPVCASNWHGIDIPDVWLEPSLPRHQREHIHQKPVGLQQALIEAVTDAGDLILDPCAGSFSVMKAALNCQRNFIGCDIAG